MLPKVPENKAVEEFTKQAAKPETAAAVEPVPEAEAEEPEEPERTEEPIAA